LSLDFAALHAEYLAKQKDKADELLAHEVRKMA
jgi:hypothetical protein